MNKSGQGGIADTLTGFSDRYVLGGNQWPPPNTFIYYYISATYSDFYPK